VATVDGCRLRHVEVTYAVKHIGRTLSRRHLEARLYERAAGNICGGGFIVSSIGLVEREKTGAL
jgi:hypothetical protein